jgi:hypothetical protein
MRAKFINELFSTDYTYDVKLTEKSSFANSDSYRYEFITKDDVKYRILLNVNKKNKMGVLNFDTIGINNRNYSSMIHLINTKDSIKVFNTLKSIIYKHIDEIDKIGIYSTEDRIKFYKKLLEHMGIKVIRESGEEYKEGDTIIIGILKK